MTQPIQSEEPSTPLERRNGEAASGTTTEDGVSDQLRRYEQKVQHFKSARLEAGRALRSILRKDLYRERGYETFEAYGREELDLSRSRLHQLINYAKVRDELSTRVDTPPGNEAQARPLADRLDTTDDREKAWKEALRRYDQISKKKVESVIADLFGTDNDEDHASERSTSSQERAKSRDGGSSDPDCPGSDGCGDSTASPESGTKRSEMEPGDVKDADAQACGSDGADSGANSPAPDADAADSDALETEDTGESESLYEERKDAFSTSLSGLDEEEARAVLSAAEALCSDEESLSSGVVQKSRKAYDRFLQEHNGSPPKPLASRDAPAIVDDFGRIPTLSGLRADDVSVSKDGEDGLLVSLPPTMVPERLRPEERRSCLVDYNALVRAGMPPHLDLEAILKEFRRLGIEPSFNKSKSGIEWAAWSVNPVTGCRHGCSFCYARDIALRFYPQGFTPTFYPERLLAIRDAELPDRAGDDWRYNNVFVSSMGDLFGKWIPEFMVEAVLNEIEKKDDFTFSFLTKYAKRLPDFDYPDNAWVGTSVISQNWVEPAEKAFRDVDAPVTWISAEPLRTHLSFDHLDRFDWVVYGAQTAANGEPAMQPEWNWIVDLYKQARWADCYVFQKDNLSVRPMESPAEKHDSKSMPELWS